MPDNFNILIYHLEGNILYNPNLLGLAEGLISSGCHIYYCLKERWYIDQTMSNHNITNVYLDDDNNINESLFKEQKISLIIGIDLGIVKAAEYAKKHHIRYGLISYEIYFKDELNEVEKNEEIKACENISFAISQDKLRALLLSIENNIDLEKIFNIPVAYFNKKLQAENKNLLRELFNIPDNKKILFYGGSIETWTGADFVFHNIDSIPDDWVMVIHYRYGNKYINEKYNIDYKGKVYYTNKLFSNYNEYEIMLSSADMGISFYYNDYLSPETGKNIYYIGLSSDKVSTYLKCGLPLLINEIGEMSHNVKKHNIGYVVENLKELNFNFLKDLNITELKQNTSIFFNQNLALDNYIEDFVDIVKNNKQVNNKVYNNSQIASILGLISQSNLLLKSKDMNNKTNNLVLQSNQLLKQYEALLIENLKLNKELNKTFAKQLEYYINRLRNIIKI